MTRYNLSPSLIARYYYFGCNRHLRYSSSPVEERARIHISESKFQQSLALAAILRSGFDWEEEVITNQITQKIHIADRDGPLHTRTHTLDETWRVSLPADHCDATITHQRSWHRYREVRIPAMQTRPPLHDRS